MKYTDDELFEMALNNDEISDDSAAYGFVEGYKSAIATTKQASEPKQPRAKKKVLGLFGVSGCFLAIVLFIPTTILYFLLFMIANPVQYILIGKHDIAKRFHKFIENVIKQNEL